MASLKITVIVPSFKRPRDLRRCLDAVALQSKAADEVLVVGRESDTETLEVVTTSQLRLPVARLVLVGEPGLVAAMNRGLDCALGDLLVFTDDDAEPQADWLERIRAEFAESSIGAVGGRDWIQLPDEPLLFRPAPVSRVGVLTWYGTQFGNHHCPLRGHARRVMFLKGVNMAFRRRALGSYRIDPNLRGSGTQSGSEMDLCSQVREAGFHVLFDDRILVKHYSSPRVTGETVGDIGDGRGQLANAAVSDICFNSHYLVAKRFGFFRAFAYFCNERLLGSRPAPGLLASVKWRLKGDRNVWRRLVQMARIGLVAFRAGRAARHQTRQNSAFLELGCSED